MLQSFLTLTTVQFSSSARFQGFLGPGDVVELAVGVVMEDKEAQGVAVGTTRVSDIGMSPFELPTAMMGRRPIRLQIRTGFSGPSSNTSASAR